MTQSQQLSSDLSEVELYRPNKRPRRSSSSSSSSSTSSTSSKTLQPERWAFVDEVPHSAQFDRQPEQITVAAPSPLLSSPRHPSSRFLPPSSSSNSSYLNTPSDGSTGSSKDLVQVVAGEEYKDKLFNQGQESQQELKEGSCTVPAYSGGESFGESEEGSKQKTKEIRNTSQYTSSTGSSEESGDGSKQWTKELSPVSRSVSDTESSEGSDCASESGFNSPAHIMATSVHQVRDILRRNQLFCDDRVIAEASGAALIAKARAILRKKRGSVWSEEKRLQVLQGIEDYRQELESTFIVNLMKHLHGDTRKVPQDKPLSETDLEQEYEWIETAWKKDHLRVRYNVNFLTDCLPQIRTGDAYHDKLLMEELPRLENPRPDVAFGIYETAFSILHKDILINQRCNLAGPQLYGVFFAIEAKCMNASIDEAENQCLRTGCAMVRTSRDLNQAVHQACMTKTTALISSSASPLTPSPTVVYPKADMDSFAFTLAVGSQSANMFVNWALEMDSNNYVHWHMHCLQTYQFRRPEDINQLHHDMNNVLEWGLSARMDKMIDCCTKIYDSGIIQPSRKRQRTDRKEKGSES